MAITGRFDADFSSFVAACHQAELSLKLFDAGTKQVESSLNRMVDNFTGRQVISEATLMVEAVTRIGSPARLTREELQRMGAAADEAIEKMNRIGGEVPAKMQALADAAARARGDSGSGVQGLGISVGSAAAVLGRFGVELPLEVRGLADLAGMAGKGAAALGATGAVALAVGTAFASWKVGKWIGDISGLTDKIADGTASLRGWSDMAGARAGAAGDVLARASKTAGHAITDMAEAMKINEAAALKTIEANNKLGASFLKAAADADRGAAIMASNKDKLAKLEHDFAVADNDFKEEQYQKKKKKAEDDKLMLSDQIHQEQALQAGRHQQSIELDEAERSHIRNIKLVTDAMREEEWQALRVQRAMTTIEYDLSTESGRKRFHDLNPSAVLSQAATPEYFQTHTIEDAIREGLLDLYAGYRRGGAAGGMVNGPQMVGSGILPIGGSSLGATDNVMVQPLVSFPSTQWGSAPVSLTVVVSNSGVFDVGSAKKLGDIVGAELMRRLKMGRQLGAG